MTLRSNTVGIVSMSFLIVGLFTHTAAYEFEIVSETGVAVGSGTPIALGQGPSINDAGKVSFIARDADATHGRVMAVDKGTVIQDCFIGTLASVADEVQINDSDQIIFRQNSDDGLFSDVIRLDGPCSGQILGSGSIHPPTPQPFDLVLPRPTLNDSGRGVFSGDIGSNTHLGTRTNGSESYTISPALTGFPDLSPMLADNNTTAVRWGGSNTSPLLRFINPNLDTANFLAESPDFNAIGQSPGISDDGNVVAFVGDHSTQGLGIYVSLFTGSNFTPIKIQGIDSVISNFSLGPRVGVNGTANIYTLTYIAFDSASTLGLYTTRIDISDPDNVQFSTPELVTEAGAAIPGLTGTVTNIKIHDPVNTQKKLAFWVETSSGKQAIVKASMVNLEILDGSEFSAGMEISDDIEILAVGGVVVEGAVVDGVTRLLLRLNVTDSGTAIFSLGGTGVSLEDGILRSIDGLQEGSSITINSVTTSQGEKVFAIYESAKNFVRQSHVTADEQVSKRTISLSIEFGSSTVDKTLRLVRPPLVLVHGLWSSSAMWELIYDKFANNSPNGLTFFPADYESTNASHFEINKDIVIDQIRVARKIYQAEERIAMIQANIVGHSMGGILSRIHAGADMWSNRQKYKREDNFLKGDIHKMITLDSVHFGSFLADFGINFSESLPTPIKTLLLKALEIADMPLDEGAVEDLKTLSPQIVYLNGVSTDPQSHAMVGDYEIIVDLKEAPGSVGDFYSILNSFGMDTSFDIIPGASDLVVSAESQAGGLVSPAASTFNHIHTGVTTQDVADEIIELLNEGTGSLSFEQGFPINLYP